eukprot:63046-Chlamydomonas_euryale.AAC.2
MQASDVASSVACMQTLCRCQPGVRTDRDNVGQDEGRGDEQQEVAEAQLGVLNARDAVEAVPAGASPGQGASGPGEKSAARRCEQGRGRVWTGQRAGVNRAEGGCEQGRARV